MTQINWICAATGMRSFHQNLEFDTPSRRAPR